MSYYFNNNFKQILELREELYYSDKIKKSDLLKLEKLISEYGILEDNRPFRIKLDAYRINSINEWLSFEYPSIKSYEDLKGCKNEPNLLKSLYNELLNKPIIDDMKKKVEIIDEKAKEVVGANIPQKVFMIGVPLGVITLIGFLANL